MTTFHQREDEMSYVPPKPHWDKPRPKDDDRRRDHSTDRDRDRWSHHKSSSSHYHRQVEYQAPPPSLPVVSCAPQAPRERLSKILAENNLNPALIEPLWTEPWPDVKTHLFDPATGLPRFVLNVEVWKPVIKAYFAWYCIPREQCTHVWADIVDMLLRLPLDTSGDSEFKVWAYGCLCKFFLEDRKRQKTDVEYVPASKPLTASPHPVPQYDPATNWRL